MNRRFVVPAVLVCLVVFSLSFAQTGSQLIQGEQLEQFLVKAKITGLRNIGKGVTLPSRATLELDGTTQYGVFKTIDEQRTAKQLDRGVEFHFQDSWRTEIAAYELDKLIGLGMVPATVERTYDGKRGSLQYWVESMMPEAERVQKKISPPDPNKWNEQIFKLRVFDQLIFNTDRHLNNILVTKDFEVRAIDHSRSFRIFDELRDPKNLTRFSKTLLAKLEELNEPVLKEHLGKYLSGDQIKCILKRRDLILKLARDLVAQKGEAAVLYP
jgi:hypothetical protein